MVDAPWFVAAENDYRGIVGLAPVGDPRIAVVVPVRNRVALLDRTLAGLATQRYRSFDVVVVDDGSDEDVAAVVASHTDRVRVRVQRQERDGFGAPRARNLGAEAAGDAEVLLFLDADCIPGPDFLTWHAFWHARAGNVVVAGTRVALDSTDLTPDAIAAGSADLAGTAGGVRDPAGGVVPGDWRRVVYRRSKRLVLGDAAFRSGLSSNLSVARRSFEEAGGFSLHFRAWGGEDTELTWRLWNDGHFVVPENRAVAFHQIQLDDHAPGGREAARRRSLALMADLVPHPFYRKVPTPFASVPKVTWIAAVEGDEAARVWAECSRATFPDAELILVGPDDALGDLVSAAAVSDRLTLIDAAAGPGAAVRAARGEIVVLLDGRARIDRRLLERVVARFDRDPRLAAVRCAYRFAGGRQYRRLDDLLAVDGELSRHGLPLFGAMRRRELRKDHAADFSEAWPAALARGRVEFLINDHATVDAQVAAPARMVRPRDLRASGSRETAKAGRRVVGAARRRLRRTGAPPPPETEGDASIPVAYVGYTGKNNLGDEAMLAATRLLLPWGGLAPDLTDPRLLVVGGGTLVNADRYYLTRILRQDAPTSERAMLGTGVRSPEFWGVTEPMEEWKAFVDSALYAGVRGPDSVRHLAALGVADEVDVFGDPALALSAPAGVERVPGRVVVCPLFAAGSLWGEDDGAAFTALAALIRRLRREGREVVAMSAFPEDDRWLLTLMRDAGAPDLPYLAGYADLDDTLRCLASADLVVGERLHASVLAAACGVPFVAVEYRPKVRDFARSVGMEQAVVRSDEMHRLDEVVTWALGERDTVAAALGAAVEAIRRHQHEVVAELHRLLTEE